MATANQANAVPNGQAPVPPAPAPVNGGDATEEIDATAPSPAFLAAFPGGVHMPWWGARGGERGSGPTSQAVRHPEARAMESWRNGYGAGFHNGRSSMLEGDSDARATPDAGFLGWAAHTAGSGSSTGNRASPSLRRTRRDSFTAVNPNAAKRRRVRPSRDRRRGDGANGRRRRAPSSARESAIRQYHSITLPEAGDFATCRVVVQRNDGFGPMYNEALDERAAAVWVRVFCDGVLWWWWRENQGSDVGQDLFLPPEVFRGWEGWQSAHAQSALYFVPWARKSTSTSTFFIAQYADHNGNLPGPEGLTVTATTSWDYRQHCVGDANLFLPPYDNDEGLFFLREHVLRRKILFGGPNWQPVVTPEALELLTRTDTWAIRDADDVVFIREWLELQEREGEMESANWEDPVTMVKSKYLIASPGVPREWRHIDLEREPRGSTLKNLDLDVRNLAYTRGVLVDHHLLEAQLMTPEALAARYVMPPADEWAEFELPMGMAGRVRTQAVTYFSSHFVHEDATPMEMSRVRSLPLWRVFLSLHVGRLAVWWMRHLYSSYRMWRPSASLIAAWYALGVHGMSLLLQSRLDAEEFFAHLNVASRIPFDRFPATWRANSVPEYPAGSRRSIGNPAGFDQESAGAHFVPYFPWRFWVLPSLRYAVELMGNRPATPSEHIWGATPLSGRNGLAGLDARGDQYDSQDLGRRVDIPSAFSLLDELPQYPNSAPFCANGSLKPGGSVEGAPEWYGHWSEPTLVTPGSGRYGAATRVYAGQVNVVECLPDARRSTVAGYIRSGRMRLMHRAAVARREDTTPAKDANQVAVQVTSVEINPSGGVASGASANRVAPVDNTTVSNGVIAGATVNRVNAIDNTEQNALVVEGVRRSNVVDDPRRRRQESSLPVLPTPPAPATPALSEEKAADDSEDSSEASINPAHDVAFGEGVGTSARRAPTFAKHISHLSPHSKPSAIADEEKGAPRVNSGVDQLEESAADVSRDAANGGTKKAEGDEAIEEVRGPQGQAGEVRR